MKKITVIALKKQYMNDVIRTVGEPVEWVSSWSSGVELGAEPVNSFAANYEINFAT